MTWKENFSLKSLNTFGMDVKARHFAAFQSKEELLMLLKQLPFEGKPIVLGGGSNILFTQDLEQPVLKNAISSIEVVAETTDSIYLKVGAGVVWHDFVTYAIAHQWAGIENLSLIPGTVGAAPIQNIGAYGVEVKSVIHRVHGVDAATGKELLWDAKDCAFGYRDSIFKRLERGSFVITYVEFCLHKSPKFHIEYGAIRQELERMGIKELTLEAVSQAVINIRTQKLPDPFVIGNAGSFFKNPEISLHQFEQLRRQDPGAVGYPQPNGSVKVAAGWLIERCGWKGYRQGDAGVHPNQALVLVNYGTATGSAIMQLANQIVTDVKETFGIQLEMEVNRY